MIDDIKVNLEKYNQSHLLKFYDELSNEEKKILESQLIGIDFTLLDMLSQKEEVFKRGAIKPLDAFTIEEIEENKSLYSEKGLDEIKKGKVGAVLLAGGQGTRLGFDSPKGCFNIGLKKELYIFECLINNLLEVVNQAETWIPLYIMTSVKNNEDTVSFLKKHKYFGYNPEYIYFFNQSMTPSVGFDGKIFMDSKYEVSLSPNGNGGWFSSLARSGLLQKIKDSGIEWLNCFAVDNVLQRIADPCFIGSVIEAGCVSGGKVVKKANPNEGVGVLCLEDGKPSIVEYYEMTEEMINSKNEKGELSYNFGVILNYIFRVDVLEKIMNLKLPLHIVKKKISHIDENGNLVKPAEPNGYKFETLILDMINMMDNCLPYEVVREKEFAPVKNKDGVDSIDTARELLIKNGVKI